ncbi:MAG: GDP-L-fucose synthase [Bacteroidales bacterium]
MNIQSKIYVAGHLGLVGSAIWRNLESKGYTNLIGRSFAELDLRNQSAVEAFFEAEKPEYVILAAAKVGGIMANNTYRGEFIYENLMIQNNVIHQAYIHGVKKLLFLGSTCIYPKESPQPMKEEYLLTGPLEPTNEPYAIAKIAGIKMCESYNLQYGTCFISVMPTNLYGPNDNFDLEKSHVLPALLRKIHLGKLLENGDFDEIVKEVNGVEVREGVKGVKDVMGVLEKFGVTRHASPEPAPAKAGVTVEIWGSGKPMREFMWSEDMADACTYLMEQTATSFVNIGTGKEISIKDLAFLIKKIVGFRGELVFNSDKPDGTMRKVTDVTRLHSLGWHHSVELEEGLRRLYDWYRRRLEVRG